MEAEAALVLASMTALSKVAAVVSPKMSGGMSSTSSCLENPVTMTGVNHAKDTYLAGGEREGRKRK